MAREATFESAFRRDVKRAGGVVRKLVTPGRRHAPDRLVIWPGRKVRGSGCLAAIIDFVELKQDGEEPQPGQQREHKRLRGWGCNVYVIDTNEKKDAYVALRTNR